MNARRNGDFLLSKCFNKGWLLKAYYDGKGFHCPYSAEDRLRAGEMFYGDFLAWRRGTAKLVTDYDAIKVDTSFLNKGSLSYGAERFRRALRLISKPCLPVVYKIVLEEKEIPLPKGLSTREKLYFRDEVKGLLCRGLDELCRFYGKIL